MRGTRKKGRAEALPFLGVPAEAEGTHHIIE